MAKGAVVDQDTCIGCGLCAQLCPKVFSMQDDGKSKAVNPTGDDEENIQAAIDACPVSAISWTDTE
jgi:ferredoxin